MLAGGSSALDMRDVRRAGMGSWLFPRPIMDASGSYTVPLAPKGSESMAPLNGQVSTSSRGP